MADLYHAQWKDGTRYSSPVSKVICVGRNFADHARELNNPIPRRPLLFIKPNSSIVLLEGTLPWPDMAEYADDLHYETELALLVGKPLRKANREEAGRAVAGLGLALDLTRRSLQAELKDQGQPWEVAKAFDGSCPLSQFVPVNDSVEWGALQFSLSIDGTLRQMGDCAQMLFPVPALLAEMSLHFTIRPGDVILTGTPAGVGKLHHGMELVLEGNFGLQCRASVA